MAATTVVASAYDTSGNGGRKLVRLNSGNLYACVKASSTVHKIYKSTNNGVSWAEFYSASLGSGLQDIALATNGTYLYFISGQANTTISVQCFKEDGTSFSPTNPDTSQTAIGNVSLTTNDAGTELHAAWSSKNSTYPNSYNIRYAKGTIDGSGNVTWGSVAQLTSYSSGGYVQNPTIVVKPNGNPIIIAERYTGADRQIVHFVWDGAAWSNPNSATCVYSGGNSYTQSNPCAVVDGNGVIHVVWHGTDSGDSTADIRYSKSTDGGATWSTMLKLTSENYGQLMASLSVDKSNKVYVYWHGAESSGNVYNLFRLVYNGSAWSAKTKLTSNTTNDARDVSVMEKEIGSMIGWIYRDIQASAVKFDSITLNNPPTLTLTNPADNQTLLAGGTLEIEGTASDADGDSITVIASLNGTALGTVGLGVGTANWTVSIPEPSLQLGDNTLVVTAIDGQGATASKTLKLTKTDGDVPLLVNDVRYKLPATDDVVAWAKREGNLTVDAALSGVENGESEWYTAMEKTASAADEDQFYKALPVKKDNVTLRLTMTRQSVDDDVAITRLIGGVGK